MTTLDHFRQALISFRLLNARGIKPTNFILCTLLNSCTQLLYLRFGLQIHARILQTAWYQHNVFINTALVNMYAKSNLILDAKSVFDAMEQHDHVSWTSIIAAYAQNGHAIQAFSLFKQMLLATHIRPNSHTFATLITTASVLLVHSQLELSASLHAQVIKLGCHSNNCVVTSLIDSYSKCGEINLAVSLYRDTLHRDVILLNSMIAAYSQNQCGEQALTLFLEMQKQNISPTHYTFSTILNACATLALLPQGTQIHSFVTKLGSETSVFVASSLIDMYSKCGSIDEARRIFDQLDHRNNILWTSMITAYAQGGRGEDGLELFDKLVKEQGMRPDNICLTAVFTACNHAGLVDRATEYFDKMRIEYDLIPELDQYACMVDLYGKTGQLTKAKKTMDEMPFEPNVVMLSSFLGSCRVYGEVQLGGEAANQLFKMDPCSAAPYVTLANIYAEAGMWNEVRQVRRTMREKGIRKSTGLSWIEVEKKVHVFSVSDTSHPQLLDIYAELDMLTMEAMEAGYMPRMKHVSEDNTNECI